MIQICFSATIIFIFYKYFYLNVVKDKIGINKSLIIHDNIHYYAFIIIIIIIIIIIKRFLIFNKLITTKIRPYTIKSMILLKHILNCS